jgi:hypothetical protein
MTLGYNAQGHLELGELQMAFQSVLSQSALSQSSNLLYCSITVDRSSFEYHQPWQTDAVQ